MGHCRDTEQNRDIGNNFENYACAVPRRLLDMTQIELAARASVSKNTVFDFEKGRSPPVKNNLAAIQRVLEEAGVEFTNGGAPGLRLRKKKR